MSSDDMHFLDVLSSIPNNILQYSSDVTNTIERNFDQAAISVRERLSTASWLPYAARPLPPAPKIPVIPVPPARIHGSGNLFWRTWTWSRDWVDDNRAVAAAVIAFSGTGGYLLWRQRRNYVKKRRARRGVGGVRKEVVVVAGTPSAPIPRSIILDLERRGFIVYVVVSSAAEEDMVRRENKVDILPLHLRVTDPQDVQSTLKNFASILADRQHQTHTSSTIHSRSNGPSPLHLTGLILIPDLQYPTGPLEATSLDLWFDTLNTRLLHTIATAQAFIPLLASAQSRILLLNPCISQSLAPPFQTLQSTTTAALSAFAASLRSELAPLDISVTELRLGLFEASSTTSIPLQQMQLDRRERSIVLDWPLAARERYASNYSAFKSSGGYGVGSGPLVHASRSAGGVRGAPLRELHNRIFDVLVTPMFGERTGGLAGWSDTLFKPSAVYRVGRGSSTQELLGRWAPDGFVSWMMGIRRDAAHGANTENGRQLGGRGVQGDLEAARRFDEEKSDKESRTTQTVRLN